MAPRRLYVYELCCEREMLSDHFVRFLHTRGFECFLLLQSSRQTSEVACVLGPGIKVGALSQINFIGCYMSLSHTRASARSLSLATARAQNCLPQPYFGNCLFNNWIIRCWWAPSTSKWADCELCAPQRAPFKLLIQLC
jgi:hypothetical protein